MPKMQATVTYTHNGKKYDITFDFPKLILSGDFLKLTNRQRALMIMEAFNVQEGFSLTANPAIKEDKTVSDAMNRTIGERIRLAREEQGMMLTELASELGITVDFMGCFEDSTIRIHADMLARISDFTGKTIQWLCGKDDPVVLDIHKTKGILKDYLPDVPAGKILNNCKEGWMGFTIKKLDRHNDYIQVYGTHNSLKGGVYGCLCDGGETIDDINDEKLIKNITPILKRWNLVLVGGMIFDYCNVEQAHDSNLVHAIVEINRTLEALGG